MAPWPLSLIFYVLAINKDEERELQEAGNVLRSQLSKWPPGYQAGWEEAAAEVEDVGPTPQVVRACDCGRVGAFLGRCRVCDRPGSLYRWLVCTCLREAPVWSPRGWESPLCGPGTSVWSQLRFEGVAQKPRFLTVSGTGSRRQM